MSLIEEMRKENFKPEEFSNVLGETAHADCVTWSRSLKQKELKTLYDAYEGVNPISLESLVSSGQPSFKIIEHFGYNNLPFFRAFSKPMYRSSEGVIAGRNAQFWEFLTGPGYFTARQLNDTEILIDYTTLPESKPDDWPRVTSNARGLSFFVFRNLQDTLRAITDRITIGRASRSGKELPQYFILVRDVF
jgi:hypothetical protein